jgi:DNA mismatch endonuclease, patch repair protein
MKANRRVDTAPELALRSALHRAGLRFRKDHRIDVPGVRVRADVAFPAKRLAIFIDGCFWHQCPEHGQMPARNVDYWRPKLDRNRERDREVNERLEGAGWTVLRFWEHEGPEQVAAEVISRLSSQPPR